MLYRKKLAQQMAGTTSRQHTNYQQGGCKGGLPPLRFPLGDGRGDIEYAKR